VIEADGAPSTFLGKQPEQVFSQEALGPKATLEVRAPCAAQRADRPRLRAAASELFGRPRRSPSASPSAGRPPSRSR
jgi:hypothetical protein